jgi:ubiquinone/menaquinone biosynthesis C-methylase UbiE
MKKSSLEFLCCPECHNDLVLSIDKLVDDEVVSGFLKCEKCGKKYKIEDEIPDFVSYRRINEKDKKWMLEYDKMARSYDILMCHLIPLFSLGLEPFDRYRWVKQLQIGKGSHVLDISTGTGKNLPFIIRQMGSEGRLTAMDISKGMLGYAKTKVKRKRWKNVELQRANASRLPYKDNTFDAVMHVGGINTFGEKKKALYEIIRVAKPKAKIAIIDEGLAPSKENTVLGRFLLRTNALYWCKPPIKLLPTNIRNLRVRWKILPFWPYYEMDFQKFN